MALQELKVNKLRTFLSLFGITIGIFCIIGVLATIDSLQQKMQNDIKALGANTIWIDKFDYSQNGPNYPWWRYVKRPTNKYEDMLFIKATTSQADKVAYFLPTSVSVGYEDNILQGVSFYGITEDFDKIQDLKIASGRYISDAEFERGTASCVMGYTNAENLFGTAEKAVGKEIAIKGRKLIIVGLIEKQGTSFVGGFNFDQCVIVPYRLFASIFDPMKAGQNLIIAHAKDGVSTKALTDELRGNMRQLRRLSPKDEDNFALNDIQVFTEVINGLFVSINLGGWAIAGLSLIVGAFGVANIMFVTVRERTSQIGLKKAIGAKSRTILTEFLLESAFLCILGGLMGLFLVWILTKILGTILPFPIVIAPNIIGLAFSICIILGVLSGIIPASIAARMDPVVAIRTK
jgi:putative ABC transport system permease protein